MSISMNITQAAYAAQAQAATMIPMQSGWDLKSFFQNAQSYIQSTGGAFLMMIGAAAVIWGGFLGVKKLFGGQSAQQTSWISVIALIIVGGALLIGGWNLMDTIASGGQDTILQLGGGMILPIFPL